jgi:hypothetical protein
MNRRARLPGADELFRGTGGQSPAGTNESASDASGLGSGRRSDGAGSADDDFGGDPGRRVVGSTDTGSRVTERPVQRGARTRRSIPDARPTGRERHDEKITVYCSPEELLQIEHARLDLRGSHGLAVDRGRIVREAIAVVLADLEAKGDASILVRRLRGR